MERAVTLGDVHTHNTFKKYKYNKVGIPKGTPTFAV